MKKKKPRAGWSERFSGMHKIGDDAYIITDIGSKVNYCAVDKKISDKIRSIASRRGVSANTLLNLLLQDKLREQPHRA